jgi:hypothetical protein
MELVRVPLELASNVAVDGQHVVDEINRKSA